MTAASIDAVRVPWPERLVERRWPLALVFVAALLGVWEGAGAVGSLPEYVLPPSEVAAAVADLARDDLFGLLLPSLQRAATGLVLGAGAGVLLGLVAGTLRAVRDLIELPILFSYPLPKIALFPVLAIWLGFEDRTRVIVIALACFYPAFLNAQSGTAGIDHNLLWLSRNAEAGRARTLAQVVLPAALPRILAGLRISVALSFVLLFATETIGYSDGLGSEIKRTFGQGDFARMYACTAVLAACGVVANGILSLITRRVDERRG